MKTATVFLASGMMAAGAFAAPQTYKALPIVNLGYERHQALSFNESTQVYQFENIRYAKNPTGNLRFRAPVAPDVDRSVVRNGSELRICPQGLPAWQVKAAGPIAEYSDPANNYSLHAWEDAIASSKLPHINFNADTTEDCLFLNVWTPKKVFDNNVDKADCGGEKAPVLVFMHGGGYVLGSKDDTQPDGYNPAGILLHAAKRSENMVYVALNYRLGALGFLSSPEVKADGVFNAGLLDQSFAFEWVQKHIHLFGGDKDRVTIMGESAGGGSTLLHLGAHGGRGPTPFKQVIAQSPAYMPSGAAVKGSYEEFLSYMNVTCLEEARAVDEKVAIAANAAQIGAAPTINYAFGPVIDGTYVPQEPITAVKQGHFNKDINMLMGHNMFEGAFFFDPTLKTESDFLAWIPRSITGLTERQVKTLADEMYPPVYDGSRGYVDMDTRQMALWGEAVLDCNFQLVSEVLKDTGYSYEFGVSPGFHTQDLDYTFGNPFSPAPFPAAQNALQAAIASFVQTGVPQMTSGHDFPHPGSPGALVNITGTGEVLAQSKVNATRCAWWGDLDRTK